MGKLRNKKTGDIGVLNISNNKYHVIAYGLPLYGNSVLCEYNTLDALMQEWEDYEELDTDVVNIYSTVVMYMGSEEEAKKAVEKLKAWKRLSENRHLFGMLIDLIYSLNSRSGEFTKYMDDINLLFGGEE